MLNISDPIMFYHLFFPAPLPGNWARSLLRSRRAFFLLVGRVFLSKVPVYEEDDEMVDCGGYDDDMDEESDVV